MTNIVEVLCIMFNLLILESESRTNIEIVPSEAKSSWRAYLHLNLRSRQKNNVCMQFKYCSDQYIRVGIYRFNQILVETYGLPPS